MSSLQPEKLQWSDPNQVHPRKSFSKTSKIPNRSHALPSPAAAGGGGGVDTHPPPASDDDSSSPNPRSQRRYVKINLSSKSGQEVREIRRKLTAELDQVRSVSKKFEKLESHNVPTGSQYSASDVGIKSVNHAKKDNLEEGSAAPPQHQISKSVPEGSGGEKRTPKANQYYKNSEFVLGKEKLAPLDSSKSKIVDAKVYNQAFKSCSLLLAKLMKHKHGWVFNTPVDVKRLGLHDYYTIIKHPMDLGTVKNKLSQNWYKTPAEFAEDVRLTFRNAMTYNPKGQDVHAMAEQLLQLFEEKWPAIEAEYLHVSSRMESNKKPPPLNARNLLERSDSTANYPLSVDSKTKPLSIATTPPVGRPPVPKKPKAKDLHKRDMTFEEKQKLSDNLQNLPHEKLDNIVQIIKKRNSSLSQNDDEIEVDIDSVDIETLWELDRFVANYRKSLSKNKRKVETPMIPRTDTYHITTDEFAKEKTSNLVAEEVHKESMIVVDEKEVASSSPKGDDPVDNASRSSSSSSSSGGSGSSSSDSETNSSSAGSDAGQSLKT